MSTAPYALHRGDCREVMAAMEAESIDAIVSDPPYGLSFMGREWDHGVPGVPFWTEALRVAKPGAHLVAFGGSRTFHRLVCAVEDAGWEIRDVLMWLYGSGFPKSLDVSKAIDNAGGYNPADVARTLWSRRESAGLSRQDVATAVGCSVASVRDWEEGRARRRGGAVENITPSPEYRARLADLLGYTADERIRSGVSVDRRGDGSTYGLGHSGVTTVGGQTDAARQWSGWGTALKPGYESIVMARKPLQLDGEARILAQKVMEAVCQISSASGAGPSSASSQADSLGLKFDSARWGAVRRCSTPGDLFALMGTWPSELEIPSSLSTAFSWLNTLGAVLGHASMFTTETASSLTTDLKTLNSFLSKTTPESMLQHETRPHGTGSSACLADAIFNGVAAKLDYILASSAAEPATSSGGNQGLRPNFSPIILARKPLRGTVARNVQTFGTGAINVDGCRLSTGPTVTRHTASSGSHRDRWDGNVATGAVTEHAGRWPSNIMLDEAAAEALDQMAPQAGASAPVRGDEASAASTGRVTGERERVPGVFHGDRGGASRFFYTSKASGEDRGRWQGNDHPTVKPTDLMRWLCRLVTPPGGLILDPFMGSGSTGVAAVEEGFRFVGIDIEQHHVDIAERRLKHAARQPGLFTEVA